MCRFKLDLSIFVNDLDEHLLLKVTYEMIFNEQNLHNNYEAYNLRGSKELLER